MNIQNSYNYSPSYNTYNQSFGLNNPKAALERAKKLQQKYGLIGLNYKLPSETLSNKEIAVLINNISKTLDCFEPCELSNFSLLQNTVNKNMPKSKNNSKILIKPFSELIKSERLRGASEEDINFINNSYSAMTQILGTTDDISIYLKPTSDVKKLKTNLLHELMHAYNNLYQNISSSDYYNIVTKNKGKFKNDSFNRFEINSNNLSNEVPIYTKNDFKKVFDIAYQKMPQDEKDLTNLNHNKHRALDEAFAYGTNAEADYEKDFYQEMTKFFATKIKELKSAKQP